MSDTNEGSTAGQVGWGIQLPIQSQSGIFVAPWERQAGPAELLAVAQAADRAGASYVAVCDHVAIPDELVDSMGSVWYDTVATIGWLAGLTQRTRLLSHVYVLPYRHPAVAAKAFATLDLLSGGRTILGVGAGHVEAEFELLGLDFSTRGRALDAAIAGVRQAFGGSFEGNAVEPRSPRPGGPPIWVGGSSKAAIRRAARLGDGWLPQGQPEMGMRGAIELIRDVQREHHGAERPIEIGIHGGIFHFGQPDWDVGEHCVTGGAAQMAPRLRKALALGATQVQMRFVARSDGELADQLERFGAEVWPEVIA